MDYEAVSVLFWQLNSHEELLFSLRAYLCYSAMN